MAHADRKHIGAGSQGKGDGGGAMTTLEEGLLPENSVLSNRDKARHGDERGADTRFIQTEQYHDHVANRRPAPDGRPEGETR